MYNELREIKVSPKKAEQIAKLSTLDQNIFRAIINSTNYSTELKLDDVFNLIPMTEKKVSKYYKMITWLGLLGIQLKIS